MPPLNDNILRTVADELLELVKKNKKISVEDAAKKLKITFDVMQSLVDFLVEEKVFGIEYKFTTPYIYIYKDEVKESTGMGRSLAKELLTKEQFYKIAKEKNVINDKIEDMWRDYLHQNLAQIREEFSRKAKERQIPDDKIQELWSKYLELFIIKMDIDEFLDREFSETGVSAPNIEQPEFKTIKGSLSNDTLELAEKSYVQLWHELMQQKLKWNKEIYEQLLSLNRQLSIALNSAYNDLKIKANRIYELINKARTALKEGKRDIAFKLYSEISETNSSIPNLFFQEKTAIRDQVMEFYKELRSATDNELIKRVYEMIRELNQMIEKINFSIKSKDITNATANYDKCIEIYNQIPEGFLMYKNSAGIVLLEIYKSLSIYTEMSNLQNHLSSVMHEPSRMPHVQQANTKKEIK